MFTTGQLVFTVIFFLIFIVVIFYSYRGDKKTHKKYYKNNIWVFVAFVLFILIILGVKFFVAE